MIANGGWGRAKVLGYHVKSDGPHGWVWRAGTSTTISYGQVAKACIEQKGQALLEQEVRLGHGRSSVLKCLGLRGES